MRLFICLLFIFSVRFQSTHPLRGATFLHILQYEYQQFQSTHPLRGATFAQQSVISRCKFQSTLPLRGATTQVKEDHSFKAISIHAPLAGCDHSDLQLRVRLIISIHAPLAGCDCDMSRETGDKRHFNPRTPCGVRRELHALLLEIVEFQSTHPLRGATVITSDVATLGCISIHAPLAGCDCRRSLCLRRAGNFNPRTPCGVRLCASPSS